MKRIISILSLLAVTICVSAQELYIATDKQCYIAGDMIWCSAFCADSNAVAYLELQSSEGRVQASKIALDKGRGAGCLRIPLSAPTGPYRLVAYTDCARLDFGYDFGAASINLAVYNTLSGERTEGGVELVHDAPSNRPVTVSAGIELDFADSLTVRNVSGSPVSLCVSVYRLDSLEPASHSSIAVHTPKASGLPQREVMGEVIRGTLHGEDTGKFSSTFGNTAFISVPGDKYCIYTSYISTGGTVIFNTDNIYGDRDLVCQIEDADGSVDCHFSPDPAFIAPAPAGLSPIPLARGMESDLVRRTRVMQDERSHAADTIYESLPMHREHVLLEEECKTYILDDYVRFPSMQELFVEIITEMHVRRRAGHNRISVLLYDPENKRVPPVWGNSLMLIDGVPVFDHDLFMTYDPALVKAVEVYPSKYSFGDRVYEGVANFVTFKGNMPSIAFNDNVRIYDYKGAAAPMSYRGRETVLWEPLVNIGAGESAGFRMELPGSPSGCAVIVEGLTESGRAVYARKIVR